MSRPIIHWEKVNDLSALEMALEACPTGVFAKEGDKVVVKNPDVCIGCRVARLLPQMVK